MHIFICILYNNDIISNMHSSKVVYNTFQKICSYLSFKTGSSEKLITILQRWHLLSDEQKSRKAKVSGCPSYMNHFTMKCTIHLMPFLCHSLVDNQNHYAFYTCDTKPSLQFKMYMCRWF